VLVKNSGARTHLDPALAKYAESGFLDPAVQKPDLLSRVAKSKKKKT
jgi:hypothetical protein